MVALNSQAERDSLGIDTLERALVYGFMMLRSSILGANNQGVADLRVKIGENIKALDDALIVLEAKLNYDAFLVNKMGGHLISHLQNLAETSLETSEITYFPSAITNPVMPPTPSQLVSLEQYIYWSAATLLASLPVDQKYLEIKRFEHNKDGSYVLVKASLPFDYKSFLLGGNYVGTVGRIATSYESFYFPNEATIGNASIINNGFSFIN